MPQMPFDDPHGRLQGVDSLKRTIRSVGDGAMARRGKNGRRLGRWVLAGCLALIPFAAAAQPVDGSCLTAGCHADKAQGRVVHPPSADGDCDLCHEAGEEGHTFTLTESSVQELCVSCHDDPTAERGTPHEAVELFGCDGCHDPHASDNPKLLVEQNVELCTGCHTDQGDALELPHVHGVIGRLGCSICHDPHASPQPKLLLARGNDLCLACHGPSAAGGGDEIELFGGLRQVTGDFLDSLPHIPLDAAGRGHPVVKHPVAGEANPADPEQPFWCGSCHRPHAASEPRLLVARGGFLLCIQCHRH